MGIKSTLFPPKQSQIRKQEGGCRANGLGNICSISGAIELKERGSRGRLESRVQRSSFKF